MKILMEMPEIAELSSVAGVLEVKVNGGEDVYVRILKLSSGMKYLLFHSILKKALSKLSS